MSTFCGAEERNMPAIIALLIAFLTGLMLPLSGMRPGVAWCLSCFVMPTYVLFAEFVLPYSGGGASFWPIALIVGGILGIMAGGLGVGISFFIVDRISKQNEKAT